MGRPQKAVKKDEHVAVYYTKPELRLIEKQANKSLVGVSPYLRKVTLEALKITVDAA